MKNSGAERLTEHLLNVDEDILSRAYDTDNAEKLKEYKKTKTKKHFFTSPWFRTSAAVAICAALLVVWVSLPFKTTLYESYAFNVWDYRCLAVFYKYIFVGRVESEIGREYDKDGVPHTFYKVTPLMNIQGELRLGEEFTYKKQGGLSKSGMLCYVLSEDILPEQGKLYIFCAKAIDNGETLYSSGKNSTIPLEENITEENLAESAVVEKMQDACEKPAYMSDDHIPVSNVRSVYDLCENPTVSTEKLFKSENAAKLLNQNTPLVLPTEKDISKLMGDYNYFFVGTVSDGGKFCVSKEGVPYVEYTVTPVYSIVDGTIINYRKQQFVEDRSIKFTKYGGITVYGNDVEITRNDVFPEAGSLYIFSCTATADGEALYSYSPYAVIPLEKPRDGGDFSQIPLVKQFMNARKEKHEVLQPVMKECGTLQVSDHTLEKHIDFLYNQEIALAEKENREPVFDYEADIYKYPDWLE